MLTPRGLPAAYRARRARGEHTHSRLLAATAGRQIPWAPEALDSDRLLHRPGVKMTADVLTKLPEPPQHWTLLEDTRYVLTAKFGS